MMRPRLLSLLLLCPGPLLAVEQSVAVVAEQAQPLQTAVGLGNVLQVIMALLLVVVLIVISAWLIRRFSGATYSRNGTLRLLAGISVGQRERVVLVQAGEVQLLLGVAPGEVRTLHVFDKPVLVDTSEGKGTERFAERLMSAMNSRKEPQG